MRKILVLFALFLLVGVASAESGQLSVDVGTSSTYTPSQASSSPSAVTFAIMKVDFTDYTHLRYMEVSSGNFGNIVTASTTFTVSTGGTGTVNYDSVTKKITWFFAGENGIAISSSPITLTYSSNIFSGIKWAGNVYFPQLTASPSSTQPVYIQTPDGQSLSTATYYTSTKATFANNYNTVYSSVYGGTVVNVSINKKITTVNTKITISNDTAIKYKESTFNNINFSYAYLYDTGLILNMSDNSGNYDIVIVNSSGSTPPVVVPTPVVDPITGVGIIFDSASYSLGAVANISWLRTIPTPLFGTDYIIMKSPSGTETQLTSSPPDAGYVKFTLGTVGTWQVFFMRNTLGFVEILGTDTAIVAATNPSYILASSPQSAGIPFNVTYSFGYTPTAQGELNSVVIEKMTGDKWEWNNAFSLNNNNIIKNTEYNKTIVLGDIGKYKIKLFELSKGYVAEIAIDSISVIIPPVKNITTSIISVDKSEYLTSDYISIYYAIDNENYSNYYNKYISVVHSSGAYPETSHILVTEQEKIIDYMSANAILQNAKKGLNYVQLRAKNNTANILLTNTSFNISFIDLYGYGLDVVNPELCKDEKLVIKYATPTNSTLRINTVGTGVPIKYYEINITGVSTFQLKLTKITDYQILIYDGVQQNVKKVTTATTKNCEAVVVTPTPPGGPEMAAQTASLLVSPMFWALMITGGLMIAIAWKTRDGFASGVIGILSAGVFTWISWIPLAIFFSVIVIAALLLASTLVAKQLTAG